MKYWMIALPRERMAKCIELQTFGLTRKFLLGHVSVDDPVVCYITKEKKIAAIGKVTQEYYLDIKDIFDDRRIYPDRIGFVAQWLPAERELDFTALVDRMSFISNTSHWSARFSAGIAEISKADWEIILDESQVAVKE